MHCHHAPEHHHHQRKMQSLSLERQDHHHNRRLEQSVDNVGCVQQNVLLAPAFGPTFRYWDDLSLLTFDSNRFRYFFIYLPKWKITIYLITLFLPHLSLGGRHVLKLGHGRLDPHVYRSYVRLLTAHVTLVVFRALACPSILNPSLCLNVFRLTIARKTNTVETLILSATHLSRWWYDSG